MQTPPIFLPGESHGWRIWWAVVHGIAKQLDMTEQQTTKNMNLALGISISTPLMYKLKTWSILTTLKDRYVLFIPESNGLKIICDEFCPTRAAGPDLRDFCKH